MAPGQTVLLVEDHDDTRLAERFVLEGCGYEVVEARTGFDALALSLAAHPRVILLDMVLPGIDGVEAIRRIRALDSPLGRIPIIGISGRGEDEAASREAGADIFLVKPVSPRALATALHDATGPSAASTS